MPTHLDNARAWTRAPWNAIAFATRQRLRWQRGTPTLRHEPKVGLFGDLDPVARRAATRRERELRAAFDLDPLRTASTRRGYRDNLYVLDLLSELVTDGLPDGALRAADVGSQHWGYVFALERFWRHAGQANRAVELHGVEIDGHGIYPDLHSRSDYARAFVAQTGNDQVRYEVADFLECDLCDLDAVTLFYPFVNRFALLRWGLPLKHFQPTGVFQKAREVLRPGGQIVVVNQTREEQQRTCELADEADLTVVRALPIESGFATPEQAELDRWGTVLRREP